ncbi:MAG TPA: HAD family hydrolase [Caldisericia bacterium]|nr:HAD family hydrolase [Caldisericia bacterium]
MKQTKDKFKAVVFDLDGTLLNTLTDLANSMNSVIVRFGFSPHPVSDYKYLAGGGVEELVIKALPDDVKDENLIKKLVNELLREYEKHCFDTTHPYDNIPELLDKLMEKGIRMAVFSNKQDKFTKIMVSKLLPKAKFEVVLGARDNVPKKPDPTSVFEIANTMKLSTEEFIYLGDSGIDMKTALAAGMYPVGALWGFRTKEELLEAGAKALIQDPLELLNFF